MKDDHLSLPKPTDIGGVASPRSAERTLLARDLVRLWASFPELDSGEARAFADDVDDARRAIGPPSDPWA